MKKASVVMAGIGFLVLLATSMAAAQSLGDLARAQRAKQSKKPAKVFTNDNLPARPASEGPTAASTISTTPPPDSSQGPAEQTSASPPESVSPPAAEEDKKKTKEYWQDLFKAARQKLAADEEQQRLLEDELGLLRIQQARELSPDAQSELQTKVKAKTAEVQAKRDQTDKSKKALEDLEKEFKESGAPANWSKTDKD